MLILIVDDENADAYSTIFEDNFGGLSDGYKLLVAETEENAINLIDGYPVDIAIVDLCMYSNDNAGITIVQHIKNKDKSTVAILITAYPEKLDAKRAYELGVYFCITKSSDLSNTYMELQNAIKNAVEYKKRLTQIAEAQKLDLLKKFFDPNVLEQYEKSYLSLLPAERSVTVVFWDIRGFTTVTESLIKYPKLVADFLKDFFNNAANLIHSNNGVLDKFIGDGIMAIFGAFDDDSELQMTENALRGVKSAIEIRSAFNKVYQHWQPKWKLKTNRPINIGIGCGINTGESIVGLLGTDERDYFTAIGHEVNLTARIEGSAERDQIRISQRTYELIREHIDASQLAPIQLKNVADLTYMYEVHNLRKAFLRKD